MTPILRQMKHGAFATRQQQPFVISRWMTMSSATPFVLNSSSTLRKYSSASTTCVSSSSSLHRLYPAAPQMIRRSLSTVSNIEAPSAPEPIIRRHNLTASEEEAKRILRRSEFQRKLIVWSVVAVYVAYLAYDFYQVRQFFDMKGKLIAQHIRENKDLLNPTFKKWEEELAQPALVEIDASPK